MTDMIYLCPHCGIDLSVSAVQLNIVEWTDSPDGIDIINICSNCNIEVVEPMVIDLDK